MNTEACYIEIIKESCCKNFKPVSDTVQFFTFFFLSLSPASDRMKFQFGCFFFSGNTSEKGQE